MWTADRVVADLTERGDLWEVAPGLIALRGQTLELYRAIESVLAALAAEETRDEWRLPPALPLRVLARADYFASFPQWLTLASHLSDDTATLEAVATADDPVASARVAAAPADAALTPAVCYHAYARFAGTTLVSPVMLTAQSTCWRHEGHAHAALERGWAFTMREIVCLGSDADTALFRSRLMVTVPALARELGVETRIAEASDAFFAPTARGKAVLQRVKSLKHELIAPLGGGRETAIASFNLHERFFGDAFSIRTDTQESAASACVAFGMERWLLAVLCAHGPDSTAWPGTLQHAIEVGP
jgi:seryl-tRNA synthetase